MTDQHLSNELIDAWANKYTEQEHTPRWVIRHVAVEAAQWGADQELKTCCEWLELNYNYTRSNHPLRTARRPKPPSLKEQALKILEINNDVDSQLSNVHYNILRSALEELPND